MGIAELRNNVDTMIVVPNERLLAVVGKGIPFQDALKKADEVLLHATQGIAGLITSTGLINVDFADVRTVMQNGGAALMGTGTGRGDNRAMEAAQQAISSPLLDNISITGATGVLINIAGGNDLTLGEASTISQIIHDAAGDDAEIIFGADIDPAMQGEVRVTVIATGFDRSITPEAGHRGGDERRPSVPDSAPRRLPPSPLHQPTPAPAPRAEPRRPGRRLGRARHGNPDLHPAADGLMKALRFLTALAVVLLGGWAAPLGELALAAPARGGTDRGGQRLDARVRHAALGRNRLRTPRAAGRGRPQPAGHRGPVGVRPPPRAHRAWCSTSSGRGSTPSPPPSRSAPAPNSGCEFVRTPDGLVRRRCSRSPGAPRSSGSRGPIDNSLYVALDQGVDAGLLDAGERERLAWDLADVYAWSVDFTRDIRPGDRFQVVLERLVSEDGEARFGHILASDLTVERPRADRLPV